MQPFHTMLPPAVVPIVMTAGSAVLPTLLAGLAGVGAALLRPRELARLLRRHAATAGATLAMLALLVGGVVYASSRPVAKPVKRTDWAVVAREILARQQVAAITPAATPTTAPTVARTFDRNGYFGAPAPRHLKQVWAYTPEDAMFLATPVVVGSRVYVAGCVAGLGDYSGLVACLDADTGKPLWETTDVNGESLKACFSSPTVTVDSKNVLIGQGFHQDRDCPLLCFDADTGKLRWAAKSTEHIESSPAVLGDLVAVGVGAIEDHAGRPTGDPGYVMAVRVNDGTLLWRAPVNDAESSPAIAADGTVYEGAGRNGHAVVAIKDGKPLWHTDVGLDVTGTVTLAGDAVVVGAGNGDFAHSGDHPEGAVIALDRSTGRVRWRATLGDTVLGPVTAVGDRLFAPVRTGDVVCLDAANGHVVWTTDISGASPVLAGFAVTDTLVYALTADGTLAVLDRADGRVLEKLATNDPAKSGSGLASATPQVTGGRVYVGTETGGVRCYAAGEAGHE